jgi:putative transposase
MWRDRFGGFLGYAESSIRRCFGTIFLNSPSKTENHALVPSTRVLGKRFDVEDGGEQKSAISIARNFTARKRNFSGESFWARGYYVSTVGLDEESVRKYIREQEAEDSRLEQLNMLHGETPPSGGL